MKTRIALVLTTAILILSACAPAQSSNRDVTGYPETGVGGGLAPQPAAVGAPSESYGNTTTDQTKATTGQERLVIQNADLTLVVADPEKKMAAISSMASAMGGFVVSSNLYQSYTSSGKAVPEGTITIRVPVAKMDAALGEIKADAVEVRKEDRTGQDVTQQYVDLNSQLTSLEAAEQQLTRIMQGAEKTEDVLNVFAQLENYRQQIAVIKGQIQYFEQAAAMSAINVTLIAEETIQPIEIGGWKPEGVARDAIQSLIKFWQGFVNFLINLFLLVLPVLVTILLPIFLVFLAVRAIIKRRRAKNSKPASD